jgi:hypothetical protein
MKNWISIFTLFFSGIILWGQDFPEGMPYQAQVLSSSGNLLDGSTIGVGFKIRQNSLLGDVVWAETHEVMLNNWSHFSVNIGSGVSTGDGSLDEFSDINWGESIYFLEMLIDEENSGFYVSVSTQQLMAVPFAFHAKTTSQKFSLSDLEDIDTTGIEIGDILKWNGVKWVPEEYDMPDSIYFAYNSDTANYAAYASYAENCLIPVWVDSANYALSGDSAIYADTSMYANYADSSTYADTADYANFSLGNWGINGNDGIDESNFLGTIDSTDLIIKTNGFERLRIKADGSIGIGVLVPQADFHVHDVNGLLFTGEFGEGEIPAEGAGTRMMWYPKKAAFRVGEVTGTNWNDARIGNYSFAAGYNTRADSPYSVAFGFSSWAGDDGAFAVGHSAEARGLYSFAAGHTPKAHGDYSIALGRGTLASATGSIAIGYHPTASGDYALALGNYALAAGTGSTALGYRARSLHEGSFIYNDYSDPSSFLETTAANQFMVQAIGGVVFYTNSELSTGVELLPGSGAWSILSDSTKKENIEPIEPIEYLKRLENLNIYEWNYISQDDSIRHIGPMAQDFHRTFNIGGDETTINSGDFDGLNIILLKALKHEIDEKKILLEDFEKIQDLLLDLERQKDLMEIRLDQLEKEMEKE